MDCPGDCFLRNSFLDRLRKHGRGKYIGTRHRATIHWHAWNHRIPRDCLRLPDCYYANNERGEFGAGYRSHWRRSKRQYTYLDTHGGTISYF